MDRSMTAGRCSALYDFVRFFMRVRVVFEDTGAFCSDAAASTSGWMRLCGIGAVCDYFYGDYI